MDIINNFSTNLKKLRLKHNLTQEKLANKLNVTKQTISLYEKEKRLPDLHTLIKISNYFNCSIDSLIYNNTDINISKLDNLSNLNKNNIEKYILEINDKNKNLITTLNKVINKLSEINEFNSKIITDFSEEFSEELSPSNIVEFNPNSNDFDFYKKTKIIKASNYHNIENHDNFSKLPCIGQVSAGYPLYANEDIERYFYISKEYRKYNEDDYFILKIKGESMNKLYKNGDYVLIRKTCCIDDTKPSVVLVNKEDATVKFVKFDEEYFYLQPYSNSPEFQENISYKKDENTLNIIGTVVGVVFEEE